MQGDRFPLGAQKPHQKLVVEFETDVKTFFSKWVAITGGIFLISDEGGKIHSHVEHMKTASIPVKVTGPPFEASYSLVRTSIKSGIRFRCIQTRERCE